MTTKIQPRRQIQVPEMLMKKEERNPTLCRRSTCQRKQGDVEKLKTRINTLTTEVGLLNTEVEVSKEASIGYRQTRNMFLDVYRRDVISDPDARWIKPISVSNTHSVDK